MANPFLSPLAAEAYEAWFEGPGRHADRLEKELLAGLLDWIGGGRSLLDVGSGTGHFTRFFYRRRLHVVGVDISLPMVYGAAHLSSPPSVLGDALQLPFDERSFDVVSIVTTLEFVVSPLRVIREAARVARRGLLIGALNRASRLGRRIRCATDEPWVGAKLLTVRELRRRIVGACEDREYQLTWSTTLWPCLSRPMRLPRGDFIGMAVRWVAPPGKESRP